jgi:hypothetical protein
MPAAMPPRWKRANDELPARECGIQYGRPCAGAAHVTGKTVAAVQATHSTPAADRQAARSVESSGPASAVLAMQRAAGNQAVRQAIGAHQRSTPTAEKRRDQSDGDLRGRPLMADERGWLERSVGRLPDRIRVEQGAEAHLVTTAVNARAAARGYQIAAERDAIDGAIGRITLAHEIGHVLQQLSSAARAPTSDQAEADADAFARTVNSGAPAAVRYSTPMAWAYQKKASQPSDTVDAMIVARDEKVVLIRMRSGKTHRLSWTTNNLPLGAHQGKRTAAGVGVVGQPADTVVLYMVGTSKMPNPATLKFPETFPLVVHKRVGGGAGTGSGAGASGKSGGKVGAGGGGKGGQTGTTAGKQQATGASGTGSTAAPPPESRVPIITVTDLKQIDELTKRGLIQASDAQAIKGKLQKGEALTFDEAIKLLDGLDRVAAPSSEKRTSEGRNSWLEWAKFMEANKDKVSGQSATKEGGMSVEQVKEVITKYKEFVGIKDPPPGSPGEEKSFDPETRKGWNALGEADKDLLRDYIKKYGPLKGPKSDSFTFGDAERFALALRISPNYVKAGGREALLQMINDPVFIVGTSLSITLYVAAWLNPEPIFSKGAAAAITIAMLSYFSASEIYNLAVAWMRLKDEASAAVTLKEIEAAAENFGKALGGTLMRVLVTLATIVAGKAVAGTKPPSGGGGIGQLAPAGPPGMKLPVPAPAPMQAVVAATQGGTTILIAADGSVMLAGGTRALMTGGTGGGGKPGPKAKIEKKAPPAKKGKYDEPLTKEEAKLTPDELRRKHILEMQAEQQRQHRGAAKREALEEPGMKEAKSPGGPVPAKLERGQLAHKWSDLLIPKNKLPPGLKAEVTAELPGGKVRLDRVDFEKGVYYEIKPNTAASKAAGEVQIRVYEEYMNKNFPLPDGRRWIGRVVTYEVGDAIGLFGL